MKLPPYKQTRDRIISIVARRILMKDFEDFEGVEMVKTSVSVDKKGEIHVT